MNSRRLLLYFVLALAAWKLGFPLARLVFGVFTSTLAAIFGSSGAIAADPSSLRAAIRNVTTDYDQVLFFIDVCVCVSPARMTP